MDAVRDQVVCVDDGLMSECEWLIELITISPQLL